jgi:outer membrane receptor protein involved in Fe transport
MVGTYTSKLETQPLVGGPSYDCAGLYGPICGTPVSHWKSRVRFTWDAPSWPLSLSLDWRYQGAVKLDANQGTQGALGFAPTGNFLLANHPSGLTLTQDEHIPAFNYFDVSGQWKIRPNLNLRAGITNIFDKTPPVLDSTDLPESTLPTGNGNTYPGVYDSLGRTIFVGLTLDF